MPGLHVQTQDSWKLVPLDDSMYDLGTRTNVVRESLDLGCRLEHGAFLMLSSPAGTPILVTGRNSDVRVNGDSLHLGIRVLRDKDEIFLSGLRVRLFYTDESLVSVIAFPGADRPIRCARCTTEIAAEDPSVQCPRCRLWYHQSADLPCWTYAYTCAQCQQLTRLDHGHSWAPEGV